jgi:hypothetical protein
MTVIDRVKDKALHALIDEYKDRDSANFYTTKDDDTFVVICTYYSEDTLGARDVVVLDGLSKPEAECLAKKCRAARNEALRVQPT